jgi:hypothetical protein
MTINVKELFDKLSGGKPLPADTPIPKILQRELDRLNGKLDFISNAELRRHNAAVLAAIRSRKVD